MIGLSFIGAHVTSGRTADGRSRRETAGAARRAARRSSQCLQPPERLAHDPTAALGERGQAFSQVGEMLLDGPAPLSTVAILKVSARSIKTEELMLDVDREIADPPADADLRLRRELLGGQRHGLGQVIFRGTIGQSKLRLADLRLAHGNSSIVSRI